MTLNLYSIDVSMVGTAYVKAKSPEEARRLLEEAVKADGSVYVDNDAESTMPICGKSFDNPQLPTISLSPAMTILSVNEGHDCSQKNVPTYAEED